MYLKLKWARFFTLAGWRWNLAASYSGFDFHVVRPCKHSECNGSHELKIRIMERRLDLLQKRHGELYSGEDMYASPHPALFGDGPKNTVWQMSHGAGGGLYRLDEWQNNAEELWERAARE